jgi:hypothetical protein
MGDCAPQLKVAGAEWGPERREEEEGGGGVARMEMGERSEMLPSLFPEPGRSRR